MFHRCKPTKTITASRLAAAMLGCASIPAAMLSALTPTAAFAQNVAGDDRSVFEQRISGAWNSDRVRVMISPQGEQLKIQAYIEVTCGGGCYFDQVLTATPIISKNADALEGLWHATGYKAADAANSGRWRLSLVGDQLEVRFLDGTPHGVSVVNLIPRSAPHGRPSPEAFERFTGSWTIPFGGTMTLREEYKRLIGEYRKPDETGVSRLRKTFLFHPENVKTVEAQGDTIVGMWQEVGASRFDAGSGGRTELTLTEGGLAFGGKLFDDPAHAVWKGSKRGANTTSSPSSGQAGGTPPLVPPPSTPLPTTPAPSPGPVPIDRGPSSETPAQGFQALSKWDVRLDKVENPRDDRLTHVYLTLRNAGTGTLLQTQDVWVYLEDSSGVEQRSGQGLQPQPGYPKLFGSPQPVVRPGKEIRTKFVFDRHQGASPTRITVEEGGKEATFEF